MHFIPIHLRFVCSYYCENFVLLKKRSGRLRSEYIGTSSVCIFYPSDCLRIFIFLTWVRPKHITHRSCFRRLSESIDLLYIFYLWDLRRYSSVNRKKFVVYQTGYGKTVKCFHESFIHFEIVFYFAFMFEIKERGHLSAFVISS